MKQKQIKHSIYLLSSLYIIAFILCISCSRNNEQVVSDYITRKAYDTYVQENDSEKAFELVNKQLGENNDDVDALYLRAILYADKHDYARALSDIDHIIKKYKGNPQIYKSTVFALAGQFYNDMRDYESSAEKYRKAYKQARKDDPDHVLSYMFKYAQELYWNGDEDKSEKVFKMMLKLDPNDCGAMGGLARSLINKKEYTKALELLDKMEAYDASYSETYRIRSCAYDILGETDKCIDAAVLFVATTGDLNQYDMMTAYFLKHYSYGVAKLKEQIIKNPDTAYWEWMLAKVYMGHTDYRRALDLLEKIENDKGEKNVISEYKSSCYLILNDYGNAHREIEKTFESAENSNYYIYKAYLHYAFGEFDKAIENYDIALKKDLTDGDLYYLIANCYRHLQGNEKALEIVERGLDMDCDNCMLLLLHGDLLKMSGREMEGNKEYRKILDLDTEPVEGSVRYYALGALEMEDEAIDWIDMLIELDSNDSGNYYSKACLLSRMGRIEEALDVLDYTITKGYYDFINIEKDFDMDPLRSNPRFLEIIEGHKKKLAEENEYVASITGSIDVQETEVEEAEAEKDTGLYQKLCEVKMKKMSGDTYEVPCTINGLPLKFIFDTGASDVTISSVEANFMLKNNYLSKNDFRGSKKYLTADGNITEGAVICLKEVVVGDAVLRNIEASVVKNQQAPLLLGQSALKRFGSITIDNQNSLLLIRQ